MEWINAVRELFGDKLALLFVLGVLLYGALAFTPFLIPACRAFSKRDRLPRPMLFVIVVGGLSYGWTEFLVTLIAIPGSAFLIYIAPSLREAELLHGSWLLSALDGFVKWWWLAFPLVLFAVAIIATKLLGKRWRALCNALAG